MYTVKTREEFEGDVKNLDESLKNARLSNVTVVRNERKIRYEFICDKTVSPEVKEMILKEAEKITPPAFSLIEVSVKKIKSNDELINNEIYKFLTTNYPSASIFLKQGDVRSEVFGDVVRYIVRVPKDSSEYLKSVGALGKLNEYLGTKFCSDFAGETEEKESEENISLLSDEVYESELNKVTHRTIKVEQVEIVDDLTMGDLAVYIEDVADGDAVICGTITDISERETKNGKPFFIINIDDTTGRTGGVYFSKKNTLPRIKRLSVGDAIIARVTVGEYNGRRSTTYNKINVCKFPENFVKKDKYKKSAPKNYKNVFPTEANVIKVKSVFEQEEPLPKELTEKEYVVFDIETTGLNDAKDEITEIGAVKIIGGKITEQFTSLIKVNAHISDEIVKITGITDEMVKNSPRISAVIPDFMKFIEGAVLVGHNVINFDYKFIKRFAGEEDFEVKNKVIDTYEMARKYLLVLKKFDLQTIADYFGIVFHHHRALADAYATAEAFIEIMKIKDKEEKAAI